MQDPMPPKSPMQEPQRMTNSHDPFWKKWMSLVVMSLALAIIVIDTTLLNVSLEVIINDLHTDLQHLQWVIAAYSLILAALTITGGRLGDLFGRKRMFILGAAIFAIGSFLASISQSFGVLLIGESIIEGIGAALMMPATSSLLVANFSGRDRAIAFGVWGGIAAASAAIGPILGGYLTAAYSWRWGFRINVVVAALLILGSVLVRESRDREEKATLDWVGVILSAVGLTAVVFGIIESSSYGWWNATQNFVIGNWTIVSGPLSVVPYSIGIGLLTLMLFGIWEWLMERWKRTPLVSLGLFGNAQFSSGVFTMSVLSLGQAGIIFSIPVFLQGVRGLNSFETGLSLLPLSIALLIAAPLSSVLSKYITPKRLIQAGLLLDIAAMLFLYFTINADSTSLTLAPGLGLYGFGMGLMMAQISNLTLSAVRVDQAGEASGLNNTGRQLGSTLGSAIIGSVLLSVLTTNISAGIAASTDIPEQFKPAIASQVQRRMTQMEFRSSNDASGGMPQQIVAELHSISQTALADGNRQSLLYAGIFVLLGFLASFSLPNVRDLERRGRSPAAGH